MAKGNPGNATAGNEPAAEWVDRKLLIPWANNPRKNDPAVKAVVESIKRFGFASPILARRENGEVIAGHTRLKAAEVLGIDRVPVRYLDLDPADAHLLALADNKLNELAEWDMGAVGMILQDLVAQGVDVTVAGFDSAELDRLLEPEVVAGEEDEDVDLTPPDEPDTQPGDLFVMGKHRLLCGDSTVATDWDRLMAGAKADMVWTDPPYGVAYEGKTKDKLTIQNDSLSPEALEVFLRDALGMAFAHCKEGGAWYVAAPQKPLFSVFSKVLDEMGIQRSVIIWVKDAFVLGRGDYHYRHEPIFYGWKPGAAHHAVKDRTQDSVWEIPRPRRSADHPTMKPVELVRRAIRNSSNEGALVVEPFGGSGTTLVACAQEKRVCYLIEKDPKYCDVIRRRYQELTGTEAKRTE